MTTAKLSLQQVKEEQTNFIARVYGWMALALVITGAVARSVASSSELLNIILGNNFVFYGILIAQFVPIVEEVIAEPVRQNQRNQFVGSFPLHRTICSTMAKPFCGVSPALVRLALHFLMFSSFRPSFLS